MSEEKKSNRLDAFKPNFTETALGFFKDEKDGGWKLVKIQFDPLLKVANKVEVTDSESDRQAIVERFKIVAARDMDVG